ncbi:DUF3105 domain-containing protein [uncultured Streptomyces sp.]|uniref:DUF3105 domain-containing protein n=1 Tax=uncultured Streptomyces sp. TaxID=174707 RepID=UPI0026268078|nr:DUF3105 domain-containing protein [uncultured Streptomyces sp.]
MHPAPPAAPTPGRSDRTGRIVAIVVGAVAVAGLVGFGSYTVLDRTVGDRPERDGAASDSKPGGPPPTAAAGGPVRGEKTWDAEKLGRDHVAGDVDYPMTPPVGGNHDQVWMNCQGDVYEKPLADVNAVHSLEHGAVWVTYNATASDADVSALASRVSSTPFTLMSPYPSQAGTITLTAWGKQLTVDGAEDERVDAFLSAYVQGPQTPEPGAPCTGGLAAPR